MIRSECPSSRSGVVLKESAPDTAFSTFREVLSAYIVGKKQLPSVRRELTRCVAASHDRAVSMLHYLRAANESGLITDAAMRMLVIDIQNAVEIVESTSQNNVARVAAPKIRANSVSRKLLVGRFEICARVGKGGIGEVYLARDMQRFAAGRRDPRVAIKIIQRRHSNSPEAIRSLQREAVNAQCLVHPGIRRVYELDRHRQRFFLVMEWLDGETLAARLDRTKGQPMAAEAFQTVMGQISSALSYAHRHGVVHGDIKPGNVFMTVQGNSKLLDFGHTEGIVSHSGSEPFAITRGYSSIEVHGGAQPEISDDVYSLAVMAYRMLVGRRPFGRYTAVEVEALDLKPERPAMLSLHQWRVLRSGLALHRENRPETVMELCNGLLQSPFRRNQRPRLVVAA